MKRMISAVCILLLSAAALSAQDIITKRNGEDVRAKVLEVSNYDVRYILFDEQDGPVYTIPTSDILMITYPSGRREVFDNVYRSDFWLFPYGEPRADIVPGMKYKELKHLYDYRNYFSGYGGRWNPALMGVCSWLIPGLGQMISGEVGRGFAWLGGSIGCYVMIGIGGSLVGSSYYYVDGQQIVENGMSSLGTVVTVASVLGLLTVNICAIVDACRVAKVKNMYDYDLRRKAYSFDLYPSVNYINTAKGMQPAAGLTLALKF